MEFAIPAIPAGVVALVAFFAPYGVAIINRPEWPAAWKKIVAVVVAILIALVAILIVYLESGAVPENWWTLFLIAIATISASYDLVTRDLGAKALEVASSTRRASATHD